MKKPGKLRWDYAEPTKKTIVVNGSRLVQYEPDVNQAYVDERFDSTAMSAAVTFLLGTGSLAKEFNLAGDAEGRLVLTPKLPDRNDLQDDAHLTAAARIICTPEVPIRRFIASRSIIICIIISIIACIICIICIISGLAIMPLCIDLCCSTIAVNNSAIASTRASPLALP